MWPYFGSVRALPAAGADGLDRVRVHHPVRDVDVVDVLLDDVIAGEPGEIQPVANLPLDVCSRPGCRVVAPEAALVPIHLSAQDFADRAVVDPLDRRDVLGLMPALRADADAKALLFREFIRREHGPDAGRVDRDRLLGEDVLARVDGGRQVCRPETGWRGEDDVVDVGRQDFLVGVEAGERPVVGDLVLGSERRVAGGFFGERGATLRQAVREQIAERHDLDAVRRTHHVHRRARPAPAAADNADANHVRASHRCAARKHHRRRRRCRRLHEGSPRNRAVLVVGHVSHPFYFVRSFRLLLQTSTFQFIVHA